ncbi:BQ5605_C002g01099 [Microbotryum silenes-dioicae]|uniref:BQ5605_C002g01099 protein n=1 Tax=Microbotryum silenes-dioicae TaxID=796604 RepID=A0A2X0P153_9BASI|nr:BQ5605_C002g01099 [Microbotryum silenes-dioicae]
MAVCINYKARHWEYKRSKSTGHYSTCCSQGKVQLPPLSGPIPSIDSCLKGRIPALKDPACFGFFDAFTIDWAHSRRPSSCHQSAPNLCQNMAHLPGRGHRHSTWTRRRRQSHTKIYFDQARFYVAYRQSFCEGICIGQSSRRLGQRVAPKWRCLSAIPTPTREIVDLKTLFSRCTVIDVPMVGPSTKSLARSIRLRCLSVTHYSSPQRKIASTSTFLFARSTKLGHSLPKDRDEEEGDTENGDGERDRGGESRVHNYLRTTCTNATSTSQSRIAPTVPSWSL